MSFGGGGGSSSIATGTDVALNNPANGQVLAYNSTLSKWQNQTLSSSSMANVASTYAFVDQLGSNIVAYLSSDGSVISQGTDAATVIQAAINAANTNANGGAVGINDGTYLITTPIVVKAKTGLVGYATFSRTGSVAAGSVLKSSGLGSGQAVVQSGGDGAFMFGIAVHANNQADYAFAHLLGADVNISHCKLLFSVNSNLYHNASSGSFAFTMENCELWGSALYGINVASGTDGRIMNCGVFESRGICVSLRAGGWLLSGCHITHSSALTTTINTEVVGSTAVITHNYFDSCKNGPALRIAGAGNTVVSNLIKNDPGDNGGALAIALDSAFGSHIANNTTYRGTGAGTIGMQWRTGGLPISGIYGPNFHLNAAQGYVDSTGTAVAVQTTSTLYVGPNVTS